MFRFMVILAVLALVVTLGLPYAPSAQAQTATNLKCKKCVGTKDIAKGAVSSNRLRPGAVTGAKIREGSVGYDHLNAAAQQRIIDLEAQPDEDTLGGLACAEGQVAKFDTSTSSWACAADEDMDTRGAFDMVVVAQPAGPDGKHALGITSYEVLDVCGTSSRPFEADVMSNPNTLGRIFAQVAAFKQFSPEIVFQLTRSGLDEQPGDVLDADVEFYVRCLDTSAAVAPRPLRHRWVCRPRPFSPRRRYLPPISTASPGRTPNAIRPPITPG